MAADIDSVRMVRQSHDQRRAALIAAVQHYQGGLRQQRRRILDTAEQTPGVAGLDDLRDFTNVLGNDLDYYILELHRLWEVFEVIKRTFSDTSCLIEVAERFETALPELEEIRNALVHPGSPERSGFSYFSALVRFEDGGRVTYLVDPRSRHHEAAEDFAKGLLQFLRDDLQRDLHGTDHPTPKE